MDYNEIINDLEQSQQQYLEIFDPLYSKNKQKKFYFIGEFKHQKVLWEVNLFAANKVQLDSLLQFYQLSHIQNNIYQIDIHLAIEELKERDILMSIIMINQYKKLDIGEHKWYRK